MSIPRPPSSGAPSGPGSRWLLAVTWLVATVLAAAVAWWAMTAVGGERRADGAGLVSQARVEQLLAAQGIDPTAPALDAPPTPSATSAPAVGPAEPGTDGAASPADPADPASPADPADPAGSEPPAIPEVARTWDVTGGQVGAVCTGTTIALLYATPADGWTVEVESAGPAELEVELSRDDADAQIRAECVGGTPEITQSEGSERDGRVGNGSEDDGGDDD